MKAQQVPKPSRDPFAEHLAGDGCDSPLISLAGLIALIRGGSDTAEA
jgi:hypothetical protein